MNRQLPIHVLARFEVNQGPVQPYMDVFAGARFISTQEKIKPDHPLAGYEDKTVRDVYTAPTFTYGAGLGCMFPLNSWAKLDMRATYSAGSGATYRYCPMYSKMATRYVTAIAAPPPINGFSGWA